MHKILIYLYIIHLLKSSTCFEHYLAHLQEVYVVIVYMQPLVSSLSAGDSCAPVKKELDKEWTNVAGFCADDNEQSDSKRKRKFVDELKNRTTSPSRRSLIHRVQSENETLVTPVPSGRAV
jgi:hypothetical protein